jgi:predicted ferric reductase
MSVKRVFWGFLLGITVLWLAAGWAVFQADSFFALRFHMVQYTGVLGTAVMSLGMILALRPRWLEARLDGLDKMYRLHKWLGIGGLVLSIVHWLWSEAPKWAVGWGWLPRPERGPRPEVTDPIQALFGDWRHLSEVVGEWAFYIVVALIALALIHRIAYHLFYLSHKLMAVLYLALVFHSVVLTSFDYWTQPVGLVYGLLMVLGTWGAVVSLVQRVGARNRVKAKVAGLSHLPTMRTVVIALEVGSDWRGHRAGQFLFLASSAWEGGHPFTITSPWDPATGRLEIMAKELGDYTKTLREDLAVGQVVTLEGPYGAFTFDGGEAGQIWVSGGIGVTPFLARLRDLRRAREAGAPVAAVDYFHAVARADEEIIPILREEAEAAGVRLTIAVDGRDEPITGERVRARVGDWSKAAIWFCGPAGFGQALRRDFADAGHDVDAGFHQELFQMR